MKYIILIYVWLSKIPNSYKIPNEGTQNLNIQKATAVAERCDI